MSRRLLILLAIDALLVAALVVLRPSGDDTSRPRFGLPALGELDRIDITRTGQRDVSLVREGTRWTVSGAPIDPYALADLEAALRTPVGADQAIALGDADADAFGLSEHALTVTLHRGPTSRTVRIGKALDAGRTFVRPLDEETIYRARADLRTAFDRPATHWRERRLFTREPNEIATLASTVGERVDYRAARATLDTPWQLTEPAGVEAGQQEIDSVANTLATAQASDFAPKGTPLVVVSTLAAETFTGERFGLELGPARDDGTVLARALGSEPIVVLPRHLAVFLTARASDLRERRVFEVEPAAVVAVLIAGTPSIRLERTDGRWRMVEPGPQPVPAGVVEGWLTGLLALRAAGFPEAVPDDAFRAPVHRLVLRLDGDRQVELVIGAPWRGGAHFARTSDRPERVMVLGAGMLTALRPAPAVFTVEPESGGQPLR